jgi:hypothetical protein
MELEAIGFPPRVKAELLKQVKARLATALEQIVAETVTQEALVAAFTRQALPVKRRRRARVIQEGSIPFGQEGVDAEAATVAGSPIPDISPL